MCLSTDVPLARNVALVREQDGRVLLTDILGVTTEIEARIARVDLMENVILLQTDEAQRPGPDLTGI